MPGIYTIEAIGVRSADRAFPLARVAAPSLSYEEWRQLCGSHKSKETPTDSSDKEEIVVARNADGYVKALCIFAARNHPIYGRVIDVPVLVVASAADNEGVTADMLEFLRSKCDGSKCSGMRFWAMDKEIWAHRLNAGYVARSDLGVFLSTQTGAAEIESALRALGIGEHGAIAQSSP